MAEVGGSVQEGDVLLALSAMKMVSNVADFPIALKTSCCQQKFNTKPLGPQYHCEIGRFGGNHVRQCW